ncbi:hypothetical protein BDV19DRAFT_385397 [Aspergillus venezuelensis]
MAFNIHPPGDQKIVLTMHPMSMNGAASTIICELLGRAYRVESSPDHACVESLRDPTWTPASPMATRAGTAWYLLETYDTAHRYRFNNNSALTEEVAQWEKDTKRLMRNAWAHRGKQLDDWVRTLCTLLEAKLRTSIPEKGKGAWIVGGKMSLADIVTFPYISHVQWTDPANQHEFPSVMAWYELMASIPAFWRGMAAVGMTFGDLPERRSL